MSAPDGNVYECRMRGRPHEINTHVQKGFLSGKEARGMPRFWADGRAEYPDVGADSGTPPPTKGPAQESPPLWPVWNRLNLLRSAADSGVCRVV